MFWGKQQQELQQSKQNKNQAEQTKNTKTNDNTKPTNKKKRKQKKKTKQKKNILSFWSCFSSVLVVAQTTKTKQQQWKKHLIIGWPHNSVKNTIKQRVSLFFVVGVSLVGVPLTRQNDKTTRQQTTTTATTTTKRPQQQQQI